MMVEKPITLSPVTKPITLHFTGEQIALPNDIRAKIDTYWQERVAQNPHLFNGEAFTVTAFKESPSSIDVELAETNFAHNIYCEAFALENYAYHVIHSACLVITSDNKLIVGEMHQNTARAGTICCSGGGLDRGDLRNDTIFDLEYSTAHELREELGIDPYDKHVTYFAPAYIKTGGPKDKITVLYELHTALNSKEFAKNYETFTTELAQKGEEIEYARLFYIDNTPEAIEKFIAEHQEHLDAYLASLLRTVSMRQPTL